MYSIHIEDGLDFNCYEKRGFLADIFAAVSGKDKIRLESTSLPAADKGQMSYIALLRKDDGLWDILEKHTHISADARDGLPTVQENIKRVSPGLTEQAARDYITEKNQLAEQLWTEKAVEQHNKRLARKLM